MSQAFPEKNQSTRHNTPVMTPYKTEAVWSGHPTHTHTRFLTLSLPLSYTHTHTQAHTHTHTHTHTLRKTEIFSRACFTFFPSDPPTETAGRLCPRAHGSTVIIQVE